jgi:DNA-directed RNA polymerase specialized sigma24 family protein
MAPPRITDAEGHRRRALSLAAHAQERLREAESKRARAIRFASGCGASPRQIAEATGVPHNTVKRIIDRERAL